MLPEKFLERMKGMIPNEWEAFVASYDQEKYQALRLNALKVNLDGETAASMGEEASFAKLRKVPWAENGYYYSAADQPGKHPFHDAGVYYIQEPSAMAPVELLDVCPGERVLDLCAAPGGKSTQIAAKLQGEGFLLCNEIHPARAKILSENVERMGIQNACVMCLYSSNR
jgi:16S rRNA C967 or C1407 C5-methylase (RsmB/RsmF family)